MENQQFEFTLVLKGIESPSTELENRLFEAGCDDGMLYFRNNIGYMDFTRLAVNLEEAILAAIHQVESVRPGQLKVSSVEPGDFVTAAEMARRLGRSKEYIRLLISGERGKGKFPLPVAGVTTKTQIWRWTEVLDWMGHKDDKTASEEQVKTAYIIREFNETLAVRESPEVYQRVKKLVKELKNP